MRPEVNARIGHRDCNDPIKFSPTAIEKGAAKGDHRVVVDVTRRKGDPGSRAVRLRRETDTRLLENRYKGWLSGLQLDHSNGLHLFRAWTRDGVLERIHEKIGESQRQQCAKDECAAAKTAENEKCNPDKNENGAPDWSRAHDRHEQVERRMRPSLVD